MTDFDFYDVVLVVHTEMARRLGVSGADGVVLGKAEGTTVTYAVLIGHQTFSLSSADLVAIGRRVSREDIYGGAQIRVEQHGNVVDSGESKL
jgi:Immunity protein 31